MTVSNTTVKQTYNGTGANTTFAIPFDFIPGEASDVTLVTLIDSLGAETVQVEGVDYDLLPAGDNPTDVEMAIAPAADEDLRVERVSILNQETDLDSLGDNTPYNPSAVENQLDRLTYQSQEQDSRIAELEAGAPSSPTPSSAVIPDWVGLTDYLEDQVVIDPSSNKLYRATSDHTSTGSFNTDYVVSGLWELVPTTGLKGDKGDKGDQGNVGSQGIQGIPGSDGADGSDGIFSEIASQAEAEAGVDNTKGMSPLRVKQAIDAQVPNLSAITDIEADVSDNADDIQDLKNRVTYLETYAQYAIGKFAGSQKLINNQAIPVALLGRFNPTPSDGRGDKFLRDGDGAEFAEVLVQIRRKNDVSNRFSTFPLTMQYIEGTWYIGRRATDQLDTSLDLDGVVLSIVTDGLTHEGQVYYTTDNMVGDDPTHFALSEIKWYGQEIPIGV